MYAQRTVVLLLQNHLRKLSQDQEKLDLVMKDEFYPVAHLKRKNIFFPYYLLLNIS